MPKAILEPRLLRTWDHGLAMDNSNILEAIKIEIFFDCNVDDVRCFQHPMLWFRPNMILCYGTYLISLLFGAASTHLAGRGGKKGIGCRWHNLSF